jgi:hypothetical protein
VLVVVVVVVVVWRCTIGGGVMFCFILCAFGIVVIHLSLSLFRRGCGDFCVLNIERNSRTLNIVYSCNYCNSVVERGVDWAPPRGRHFA